jgi:5-methylcytosine-specific restriction protein A
MAESYKELYKRLRDTEFGCVPAGAHETDEVYEMVREEYPELCDDSISCQDVCGTDREQPEWQHRVRTVQQDLKRNPDSRVQRLNNDWYYGPKEVGFAPVPDTDTFDVGEKYNRWELHDKFGGQRYSGISTPANHPLIFIFTGDSGEEYGYDDEFRDDGSFMYTGEGTEGDMVMEGGNEAIRAHQQNAEDIHLFEDTDYPWIVTYVGQFEYVGHDWVTLEDQDGKDREAIRFRLEPVGGTEVEIEDGTPRSLSDSELFEKAKQSTPDSSGRARSSGTSSSGGRHYSRSEVVKEFALRAADGVCQGCEDTAPFRDEQGDWFLEVHHLHRRSDGGADDPENVIALCPNCHRRVHHGQDGEEFNQRLIEKAEERNQEFSESSF